MLVSDLINILKGQDLDSEVRLAMQPSWPFEYSISEVVVVDDVTYLSEGTQLGYLPSEVKKELTW